MNFIAYLCFIFSTGSKSDTHPFLIFLWWRQQYHFQRSRCCNSSFPLSKVEFIRWEAFLENCMKDAFLMNPKRFQSKLEKLHLFKVEKLYLYQTKKRFHSKLKRKVFTALFPVPIWHFHFICVKHWSEHSSQWIYEYSYFPLFFQIKYETWFVSLYRVIFRF